MHTKICDWIIKTQFKRIAENDGDLYIMRFTSDYCPLNSEYPMVCENQPWNSPPCTSTGYVGSAQYIIPEYTYGVGHDITDGVIYRVDNMRNETVVAVWKHGRFNKVN